MSQLVNEIAIDWSKSLDEEAIIELSSDILEISVSIEKLLEFARESGYECRIDTNKNFIFYSTI